MSAREAPARQAMSKRRALKLAALWSLGIGGALLVIGWGLWHAEVAVWVSQTTMSIGAVALLLGVIWLACLPWVSREPMRGHQRRYLRMFWPAMAGYVIAIVVLVSLEKLGLPTWAMTLLALLPVVPMAWVVVAMWRFARDADELERRVELESIFLTCGVVGLAAFAGGMLQMAGVIHLQAGLFWVLPAMFLVYGVAGRWCRRKYGLEGLC